MSERMIADNVCRTLHDEGVRVVFGHPGGAILPLYDAFYRFGRIRHVLARHEQSAAHAADGYARATGRVGVCVATSGPGGTNLVTGLATALMDSVPLVAITGQVARDAMGTQAFQETDILGVTMPVTKHGFLLTDPEDASAVIREAFRLARAGRPGPVLVDLPKDVQTAPATLDRARNGNRPAGAPAVVEGGTRPAGRDRDRLRHASVRGNGVRRPPPEAFDRAAAIVNGADRPVIMAGRGVVLSGTSSCLRALAERADLPVITTLLGLDAFPSSHPLCLGLPGMHGTERTNRAIQEADAILGLGLRFDDRVTGPPNRFAPRARIVHLDVDPAAPGRTVRPAESLVGDLRKTLPELARRIRSRRNPTWRRRLGGWSGDAADADGPADGTSVLGGRTAARALARRISARGDVAVTDVGQHQMWMAQELGDAAPGTHLTSGGLGTMGYALPAAMGAAVGRPDRSVWVVAGDGGFQMTLQELATVAQEDVPLRIVVMNNGYLGMVRQWQELFYGGRYSATRLGNPDLAVLASAYGIPARSVERSEELDEALDWAEGSDGPLLLELKVLSEENVYPIVPGGAAIDELIGAPTLAETR